MARIRFLAVIIGLLPAMLFAAGEVYRPAAVTPPPPMREFRGAWLVTVANIDWPSKPGLSVVEQQAELIALLDHAVQLKLNAIVFQVRPVRRGVCLGHRAVVGISHRHNGPGAAAIL